MELEVGDGLTGEEVVVEAAHRRRRRRHRHPLEETLPLHRQTHLVQGDHQNAAGGANTSLTHHEQGRSAI